MKKGTKSRLLALLCAFALAFCDVGYALAENNQGGIELPDQDFTEQPDDSKPETPDEPGTPDDSKPETPDEPQQPEHTHSYVETITKEPTYTEKGEKTFTCECGDSYTEEIKMLKLEKTSLNEWINTAEGISLAWDPVEGATYYKVFRGGKDDNYSDYKEIATITEPETTYLDKEVQPGTIYSYSVVAYNETNSSDYSFNRTIMHLTKPDFRGVMTENGVELSWDKVVGASHYVLERYESYRWVMMAMPDSTTTTHRDTEFVVGKENRYRIQAFYADDSLSSSSEMSEEVSCVWEKLLAPKSFKVVNNGYTQLKLTWESSVGAESYQIYRSTTNEKGTFKLVSGVVDNTTYIDKKLTPDKKYYYKIRACFNGEKSEFTEVKSATPKVLTPKMKKSANAAGNYVKVSWTKPAGAHGYYVYRKQGADGTWKQIATVKDPDTTSYKDTTATGKYYYAVKAYKKVDGKTYTSLRANSIQASVLKKASITVKQDGTNRAVTIEWGKVNNATGYQVYKKVGKNGSWKLAKTTNVDARTFTATIPQGTYTYWKVRAIRKIGEATTYALFSDSKSFIFANPKFTFEVSDNYGSSVKKIKLTIENTSSATLRFYTENAMLMDEEDDSYARDLYLTGSSGQKFTYSEVKAGKTKTFTYTVDGEATRYHANTVVGFMFRYDGLKYVLLTYADGSYFELYLEEDIFE